MKPTTSSLSLISRGAIIIAAFSILSRLLGLVRDRLLASTFGATATLDAYYAAFKLPDFIFNTFVLGALAVAFIPSYIRLKNEAGPNQAWLLVSRLLNWLVIFLLAAAIVGIIFANHLVPIIAPGFSLETLALSVRLTRLMLLSIVVFGASNLLGSVLQAERRFTAYALAPVLYNLGLIFGIVLLVPYVGIIGLAWGVLIGSFGHLLVQLPAVLKLGFKWQASFDWRDKYFKQVFKLLLPRTFGLAASSLNDIITAAFISHLAAGSLAAFALAVNLHSFPINVFGVSLAIAVFPLFSQAFSLSRPDDFRQQFVASVRRILFYILPVAVMLLVLRAQIVRVVLGSGSFDWLATIRTAQMLGFLALALVSDSLIPLVARAFYALPDTKTPVIASLASLLVNVSLLITLRPLGLTGIGLAYVAASLTNLCLLLWLLSRRLGSLGSQEIIAGLKPMMAAAFLAGSVAYLVLRLMAPVVDMRTFVGIFSQGLVAGLSGVAVYVTLVYIWRLAEVKFIKQIWLSGQTFVKRLWIRN
ncbi:murein biosynthesis integral membrane protein MurJ [Patescibacteria group bacterium]|nr:murein biosynthesis integral membrane protein MurJ [Patescibacteria group bacterium]